MTVTFHEGIEIDFSDAVEGTAYSVILPKPGTHSEPAFFLAITDDHGRRVLAMVPFRISDAQQVLDNITTAIRGVQAGAEGGGSA